MRVGSLCGFVRRRSAFLVPGEWWDPCFIELPPEPQNLCVTAHICEKPFTLAIYFFHSLIGAGKTHFESIREWWVVQQLLVISRKCKGRSWKISCSCSLWIIQPKIKWILLVTYWNKSTGVYTAGHVWYLMILKRSCEWIRCSFLCRLSLAFICHVNLGWCRWCSHLLPISERGLVNPLFGIPRVWRCYASLPFHKHAGWSIHPGLLTQTWLCLAFRKGSEIRFSPPTGTVDKTYRPTALSAHF